MKIALLNLPYDNNYGGNLQRYALMKVLQDMGHDVTHINLRFHYHLPWYKTPYLYTKRIILKYVFGRSIRINQERYSQQEYEKRCSITNPFYQKYIKHTEPITNLKQLRQHLNFDAYVVGSDQVWRKRIAGRYLKSMFLDFLPRDTKVKRIAYGVSLGVAENELNEKEIKQLTELYCRFDAVSVREDSALELFKQYGWREPQATHVLDPTMLLKKEDYIALIERGNTVPSNGNLFCYILDKTEDKRILISQKAEEQHLKPFELGLDKPACIEQWLRSFADAEYVITDSYHGLVFSIIFNKPFCLILNKFRGNARFLSLMETLCVNDGMTDFDQKKTEGVINVEREKSVSFLIQNINNK